MFTFTLLLTFWARVLLLSFTPDAAAAPLNARNTATEASKAFVVEQVIWSNERKLSWEDFKAQPDDANPHHALTAANLAVNAKCKDNKYTYVVNCVFLPRQSWSKNKVSEKLLVHEQLHFDLTEVHARQLRRDLQQLNCTTVKKSLNDVVSNAFAKWKAEQDTFDEDCRHGLDKSAQKHWANTIQARLDKLEVYK